MLTSYLDIQKCLLILLNWTKLSPDQKWLEFDTLVPTVFTIIFNSKNKILWIMMSSVYMPSMLPPGPTQNQDHLVPLLAPILSTSVYRAQ